jgi:hypothetical protein
MKTFIVAIIIAVILNLIVGGAAYLFGTTFERAMSYFAPFLLGAFSAMLARVLTDE